LQRGWLRAPVGARRRNRETDAKPGQSRSGQKTAGFSQKHGNTVADTLRNIYGSTFAAGQPLAADDQTARFINTDFGNWAKCAS